MPPPPYISILPVTVLALRSWAAPSAKVSISVLKKRNRDPESLIGFLLPVGFVAPSSDKSPGITAPRLWATPGNSGIDKIDDGENKVVPKIPLDNYTATT